MIKTIFKNGRVAMIITQSKRCESDHHNITYSANQVFKSSIFNISPWRVSAFLLKAFNLDLTLGHAQDSPEESDQPA